MADGGRIADLLEAHVSLGDFPGASYLVAEGSRVLAEGAVGHAVLVPRAIRASPRTLYDLASLTKPLATALLAARLRSEGRLRFDDAVASHLPGWGARGFEDRAEITLLDLLTHRSGLPAWKPLYLHASDGPGYLARLNEIPLVRPPRHGVEYSDLGYIVLGFVLQEVAGGPLDRLFARQASAPLGLRDLLYRPPASLRPRIAATETGNARERDLAAPEGRGYNGWRREVIWGQVHDLNAHTLGGVAGHSGLFGTARDVFALAGEFLSGRGRVVPDDQREMFRANLTAGCAQDRSIGFQLATTPGCSAGPALSRRSFGHVGFTGTSLWIDPESRRVYVLLTNRVHPRFRPIDMNAIRRDFHRTAAEL
ncbi:MAG: serine hydrolase domain-containing protein [Acidobacteriota bacterium]